MTAQKILRAKCARCGHGYSFHGKATNVTCKAMGCRGGPKGGRCPGFVSPSASPTFSDSLSAQP